MPANCNTEQSVRFDEILSIQCKWVQDCVYELETVLLRCFPHSFIGKFTLIKICHNKAFLSNLKITSRRETRPSMFKN